MRGYWYTLASCSASSISCLNAHPGRPLAVVTISVNTRELHMIHAAALRSLALSRCTRREMAIWLPRIAGHIHVHLHEGLLVTCGRESVTLHRVFPLQVFFSTEIAHRKLIPNRNDYNFGKCGSFGKVFWDE